MVLATIDNILIKRRPLFKTLKEIQLAIAIKVLGRQLEYACL